MKKKEAIKLLKAHIENVKNLNEWCDKINNIFGNLSDEQYRILYASSDMAGELLEQKICKNENSDTWISWFIWDNDMGEKGREAGFKGKMRPIKTVEDLYWVMTEKE